MRPHAKAAQALKAAQTFKNADHWKRLTRWNDAGYYTLQTGCIGKKGAPYAAFFWGFTNGWGVSRAWTAPDR